MNYLDMPSGKLVAMSFIILISFLSTFVCNFVTMCHTCQLFQYRLFFSPSPFFFPIQLSFLFTCFIQLSYLYLLFRKHSCKFSILHFFLHSNTILKEQLTHMQREKYSYRYFFHLFDKTASNFMCIFISILQSKVPFSLNPYLYQLSFSFYLCIYLSLCWVFVVHELSLVAVSKWELLLLLFMGFLLQWLLLL